jgi:hypothetical protein
LNCTSLLVASRTLYASGVSLSLKHYQVENWCWLLPTFPRLLLLLLLLLPLLGARRLCPHNTTSLKGCVAWQLRRSAQPPQAVVLLHCKPICPAIGHMLTHPTVAAIYFPP